MLQKCIESITHRRWILTTGSSGMSISMLSRCTMDSLCHFCFRKPRTGHRLDPGHRWFSDCSSHVLRLLYRWWPARNTHIQIHRWIGNHKAISVDQAIQRSLHGSTVYWTVREPASSKKSASDLCVSPEPWHVLTNWYNSSNPINP